MKKPSQQAVLKEVEALEAAGKFHDAVATLTAATKTMPNDATLSARLILIYNRRLNEPRKGAAEMVRLLKLAPKSPVTHELAAEIALQLNAMDQAKKHADEMVRLRTTSPDGLYIGATIYQKLALHDRTVLCLKEALRLRPGHLQSRLLYAATLRTMGQLTEAEAIAREIFAEHPNNLHNFNIWSIACKQTADDPMYLHLRDFVEPVLRKHDDPNHSMILGILGKAENDIGNYDVAFERFTEAKAARKIDHDRSKNANFVASVVTGTSRAQFFGWQGNPSKVPVFVVGMPRTGSTLMEQILASHPQIGGIGESGLLRSISINEGYEPLDGASLVQFIKGLTQERAEELSARYLEQAQRENQNASRIVDKKLHNFEHLGVAAKLFPNARIIHALRDPMDNCVSCYMQRLKKYHSYTQDLTSLGQYYCEHRALMDHWKKVLPNPFMDVYYEDVVADTEGMARKIIDFLGLEWDPACLDFQKNEKRVTTSSIWQVRQPIYQTSVKRWQRYDKHLGPLKDALAPFYPDGFDEGR